MASSFKFGNYTLSSSNGVSVNVVREKSPADRDVGLIQPARARGMSIVSLTPKAKIIEIEGTISHTNSAQTHIDNVRDFVASFYKKANLQLVTRDGTFIYENCVCINPESMLRAEQHWNIDFIPFRVELLAPKGVAIAVSDTTNAFDDISSSPYTNDVTINGSLAAEPVITLTLDSTGGNSISELTFLNRTSNESISIATSYASDDVVQIDTRQKSVLYNTQPKSFTGLFPRFDLSRNRFKVDVESSDTVVISQTNSDSTRSVFSSNHLAQQINPDSNITVPQIDLLIKKVVNEEQSFRVLIVAGGGGGGGTPSGNKAGGGGGAGEYYAETGRLITAGEYAVVVGSGGSGGAAGSNDGSDGGDSSFDGVVANGGGGGGTGSTTNAPHPGRDGGSGGGGGERNNASGGSSVKTAGGLGNAGAAGDETVEGVGGGGGGSGSSGDPNGNNSEQGGSGTSNNISGSTVTYTQGGGGGGAGSGTGSSPGTAGSGGGGANRDGGAQAGADGEDGVVIIRYETGTVDATGGTITTDGGDTIHTFTSNGTFTINEQGTVSDLTVAIETDSSGEPSGSSVTNGTTTIAASDIGTDSFSIIPANFETAPSLTSGTDYHIVLSETGGDVNNFYSVKLNTSGGYAQGNVETSSDSGSSWTERTGEDLYFRVYNSFPSGFNLDVDIDYRITHHSVV